MTPDLTKKEREANKKLRDELHRRKGAGETNLAIRNGKIVMLKPATETERQMQKTSTQTVQAVAAELAVAPSGAVSNHSVQPAWASNKRQTQAQVDVVGASAEAAAAPVGPVSSRPAGNDAEGATVASVEAGSYRSAQTAQAPNKRQMQVPQAAAGVTAGVAVTSVGAVSDRSAGMEAGEAAVAPTEAGSRRSALGAQDATHVPQGSIFTED